MSNLYSFQISPGQIINQNTQINSQAIKFTNRTLYDMQVSGYGFESTDWIPAGTEYMLDAGIYNSGNISFEAFNNALINNPAPGPVLLTEYISGENVPAGHWPVSIPQTSVQTVTTSSTLSNESQPAGTEIIDIGTPGNLKAIDIFNDHFIWSVIQSGVAHQVLKGQTSGNPLQIGATGDVTEFLSKPTFDDVATFLQGFFIIENAKTSQIFNESTGRLTIQNPTTIYMNINGTNMMHFDSNGMGISNGKIYTLAQAFSRLSIVSFTSVNGTTSAINHNLGATPTLIVGNAFTTGVSSANVTLGFSEVGATTFKASSIAAVPCIALCLAQ